MIMLLLALQVVTIVTKPPQEPPIMVATESCRNLFDERIMRATGEEPVKYSLVVEGKRYRITPSRVPGAVYAEPVDTEGEGTSEVRASCFGL
jgi:hypothetical protein